MRFRSLGLLFFVLGCEATVPTPEARTFNTPPVPTTSRQASRAEYWRPLQIRYLGDGAHRSAELTPLHPARVRIVNRRVVGDEELPLMVADYLVPGSETVIRFQATDHGGLACYAQFAVLQAMAVGRTAQIAQRQTDATCEILVLLTSNDMPPPTADGNGMWGTRNGPPVDPLDDTLP